MVSVWGGYMAKEATEITNSLRELNNFIGEQIKKNLEIRSI